MEAVTVSRLGLRKCLSYLEHGVKWNLEVNHLTVFLGELIHSGYRVKLERKPKHNLSTLLCFFNFLLGDASYWSNPTEVREHENSGDITLGDHRGRQSKEGHRRYLGGK